MVIIIIIIGIPRVLLVLRLLVRLVVVVVGSGHRDVIRITTGGTGGGDGDRFGSIPYRIGTCQMSVAHHTGSIITIAIIVISIIIIIATVIIIGEMRRMGMVLVVVLEMTAVTVVKGILVRWKNNVVGWWW
jgi:hypothetical protein